jgi:hypothetical protein
MRYSKAFYNSRVRHFAYDLETQHLDLFSMLSDEDLEDIVGLYLQVRGYLIVPSSCKRDTPNYEFVMYHRETGRSCVAQVKSGNATIDVRAFGNEADDIYVFAAGEQYIGEASENVIRLGRDTVEDFLTANLRVMPVRIRKRVEMLTQLQGNTALG